MEVIKYKDIDIGINYRSIYTDPEFLMHNQIYFNRSIIMPKKLEKALLSSVIAQVY